MLRAVLLALIALGLGGFAMIAWVVSPAQDQAVAAPAAPSTVAVLTAARAIRPGSMLKPEDIMASEVPLASLPPGYVPSQGNAGRSLIGGMVRRSMAPGDVLRLPLDVVRPADHGFLAAVLTPGTRAVTIGVDVISGTGGLIWPGDRVDLILTQSSTEPLTAPGRRISAETLLRDVRVIAIDQQLVQGAGSDDKDQGTARTVTLEVSPSSAETVNVATRLGQISLVVRSAETGPAGKSGPGVTYAGDVTNALPSQSQRQAPGSIKVYGGATDGKEFKF